MRLNPFFRTVAPLCTVFLTTVLVGIETTASAQTYLFDFGGGGTPTTVGAPPNDPVNHWNNVTESVGGSATGQLTNIVTAVNAPSTMGLAMISRFNAANANGTLVSTVFATNATRDSLYGNTGVFNGLANVFPSFKLTGLDPATTYDLTFYASRTTVSDNRETGYTVTGANNGFAALDAANNVDNTATVTAISPTAEGEIRIDIAPTANNNNGATRFTYLGVLKVAATPPQTPIGFTLEPVNTRAVALSDATFTAAVTGAPPHFVQWLSNGVAIPGANQLSYTIQSVQLDMDGSQFSVNVSNLAYSATSSNATLRVVDDIDPPYVTSIATLDGSTITLCFNEVLDKGSAEEPFHFLINDGLLGTPVLSQDGRCVAVTVDEAVSGTFKVTVEGIVDLSGNPIVTTNVFGEVPNAAVQMVLIDFGAGTTTTERGSAPADDSVRYWNNVTTTIGQSDTAQLNPLVTTQNLATALGLQMIRRFNGANENGTTDPTAPYPTDATRDSLFGNTETFSGLADIFPSFKITGLDPAKTYSLTMYASRTAVNDTRETRYTVEGQTTTAADLNVANNITESVTVANMQPNATGEITISLTPGPNNNNGNHFTYLGVLAIMPSAGTAGSFVVPTVSNGNIVLQWTGSGQLQAGPTVTGPWTDVTPSGVNTHTEAVSPGANRFYRLFQP